MGVVADVVVPLGSAFLGAIAGYFPASHLAKRASKEILERDAQARRDQDIRAARQVFVKLHIIGNSLGSLYEQLTGMIATAETDGNSGMALHEKLSVFAGIEREPTVLFTAEELSIYIAAKQPEYVDDLLLLSRRYTAVLVGLTTFGELKTSLYELTARVGSTTRADTGVTTTRISAAEPLANLVFVKSGDLEIFITALVEQIADYDAFARDVVGRFADVTSAYLGKGVVMGFEPGDASNTATG